jgi:hypothetical protein
LGKDCDVYSKEYGYGYWYYLKHGKKVKIKFNDQMKVDKEFLLSLEDKWFTSMPGDKAKCSIDPYRLQYNHKNSKKGLK